MLDDADAPVLQVVLARRTRGGNGRRRRAASAPADLAMNVVLPEIDGRILTRAISFKGETRRIDDARIHAASRTRRSPTASPSSPISRRAWARLRRTPRAERRLACILSDYPAKGGRAGYAVGLDTPRRASPRSRRLLAEAGLRRRRDLPARGRSDRRAVSDGATDARPAARRLPALRSQHCRTISRGRLRRAGASAGSRSGRRATARSASRCLRAGSLVVALQPDRGRAAIAQGATITTPRCRRATPMSRFYLWLREVERIDALIHCGAHGTLEWLPGKAVALSKPARREAVLGADAGDLSLHRQQSRRGGAGQAPHRAP